MRVNNIHELTYRLHVLVNNFHERPPSVCILSRSWTSNFCKHFLMSGGTPHLKGQCHKIFCFRIFSWIIFPQAPENNTTVILNCLNSCRDIHKSRCTSGVNYIGGKFCHRYRWCWYWWQIMGTISDWWRLKLIWRKKFILWRAALYVHSS